MAARPLLDDVDGLLDEIDQVLETNAEEFVRGYVQKGGE
jgi:ubiquitin-like protein Pup